MSFISFFSLVTSPFSKANLAYFYFVSFKFLFVFNLYFLIISTIVLTVMYYFVQSPQLTFFDRTFFLKKFFKLSIVFQIFISFFMFLLSFFMYVSYLYASSGILFNNSLFLLPKSTPFFESSLIL